MSDEEQLSSGSDVDKRNHHNMLERKRRDHLKHSFTALRDVLPVFKSTKGKKVRASRAQILKKTAEYIRSHQKKGVKVDPHETNRIRQENAKMEEQIRILKAAIDSGNLMDGLPVMAELQDLSSESSSSDGEEDGDKQDDDDDDEWTTESDDEESGGYATDMSPAQQVQA